MSDSFGLIPQMRYEYEPDHSYAYGVTRAEIDPDAEFDIGDAEEQLIIIEACS